MINEGLIEEKGMATGRRRRAVTYGPTRSFVTAIIYNVEVLETLVAVGFLDGTWRIVERFPTPRVFEEFKEKVKESYENILRTHTLNESISKLVFSLPGIVNTEKRLLIHAPNLGWRDVDFQKEVTVCSKFHPIFQRRSFSGWERWTNWKKGQKSSEKKH
ncbi:ROK family protein [Thermotoga sp. Cell2]|nr:ROK family protein [Thermotoga sp. Cell2]